MNHRRRDDIGKFYYAYIVADRGVIVISLPYTRWGRQWLIRCWNEDTADETVSSPLYMTVER